MNKLTLVTVTYNSSAVIGSLLAPLAGMDTIVVDNASSDNTCEIASGFPGVRIIPNKNEGYGRAANRGFSHAHTPYILLLNPDVVISKESVDAMLAAMESDPKIAVASARIFSQTQDGAKKFTHTYAFDANGIAYVEWVVGAVMLIRYETLQKCGMFDENFFLFFEETDLCKRFVDAGYKLAVVQAAEAEHSEGSSSAPSLKLLKIKAWHNAWSKIYFQRKHLAYGVFACKAIAKIVRSIGKIYLACLQGNVQARTENIYALRGAVAAVFGIKAFKNDVGRFT